MQGIDRALSPRSVVPTPPKSKLPASLLIRLCSVHVPGLWQSAMPKFVPDSGFVFIGEIS
jgi:hypothetical protein